MNGQAPRPGGLRVESTSDAEGVTVTLRGELDLAAVPGLEQRLAAIEADEPERIVIDLSGVSFIDSSGLRVLLLTGGRAREHGRELLLSSPTEAVRRVLELTGALEMLRFQT